MTGLQNLCHHATRYLRQSDEDQLDVKCFHLRFQSPTASQNLDALQAKPHLAGVVIEEANHLVADLRIAANFRNESPAGLSRSIDSHSLGCDPRSSSAPFIQN